MYNHDSIRRFIGSLLESGEGAWIGLNDRYTESVYIWNQDKDDEATRNMFWAKNEPSNTNSKCNIENCVEMKYPGLRWNDMIYNGYNSYVCQLKNDNENGERSKVSVRPFTVCVCLYSCLCVCLSV